MGNVFCTTSENPEMNVEKYVFTVVLYTTHFRDVLYLRAPLNTTMSDQPTLYPFDDLPLLTSDLLSPKKTQKKAPKEVVEHIYTVGEFLDVVNQKIKSIETTIQGEIGKVDVRGAAVYFTLNDKKEKATLSCIVWRNKLNSMGIELREGLEVKVVGHPTIYKPMGKFSLEVQYITPIGEGALKLAFEKLKRDLEAKGYFNEARKRPLPRYPQKIGLITSMSGEAQRDFITHLGTYGLKVYFYDVRVEGVKSIPSVVSAIQWFNEHDTGVEVLVVTRGGGSLESLQAFNSEEVAKAIFSSRIPVISAIGHERDVTIADHVADCRASTPTHAGKMLSEYWSLAAQTIETYEQNISAVFKNRCSRLKEILTHYEATWITGFMRSIYARRERLATLESSLTGSFRHIFQRLEFIEKTFAMNHLKLQTSINTVSQNLMRAEQELINGAECYHSFLIKYLDHLNNGLILSDPELKLKQGYSITKNSAGNVLKDPAATMKGDIITVQLYKGSLTSKVEKNT